MITISKKDISGILENIKMKKQFFKDYVIVSCGTLSTELNYLR